jgi:hypothetical protein
MEGNGGIIQINCSIDQIQINYSTCHEFYGGKMVKLERRFNLP